MELLEAFCDAPDTLLLCDHPIGNLAVRSSWLTTTLIWSLSEEGLRRRGGIKKTVIMKPSLVKSFDAQWLSKCPVMGWVSLIAIKLQWGILLVQANCLSRQPGRISKVFVSLCRYFYWHGRSVISSDANSWFVDAGNEDLDMG